jgi:hypothetical protein
MHGCCVWGIDLRPIMGNPDPDAVVTFHVVVRPAKAGRGSGVHHLEASIPRKYSGH